jgi:catechol 2,3-dioxygenase-like lactoylglutathione lyase family enzyme
MISYVTIGTNDIDASVKFYDAVLATLDCQRTFLTDGFAGYGANDGAGPSVMVCRPHDGQPATASNGSMVGLRAASEAQVQAFHAAALANGGTCEGEPGLRPYGEGFYLAYVRDPQGNKLSAFHKPQA